MPSNHLILCHTLLLLPTVFPQIRVFSRVSALRIRWSRFGASVSASVLPMNEQSGLISFRIDWFDDLAVQGTLKSLLQCYNSKASITWHSAFFMVQLLTSLHDYWKNHSFDSTLKVMSLLFNTLSSFVIAFLLRSECLLISWLQSPSTVILELKEIKSVTVSTFYPSICHEVVEPDAMNFIF